MIGHTLIRIAFCIVTAAVLPCGASAAVSLSAPHDQSNGYSCSTCHTVHTSQTGGSAYNNACLDCHRPGVPLGGNRPFVNADAADPFGSYTADRPPRMYQNSHRWDGSDTVPQAGAQPPLTAALNKSTISGSLSCVRCHNQHGDASPATPHLLRSANDQDQLCRDCHRSRDVTSHTAGSHPVRVTYADVYANHTATYRSAPLNTNPANSSSAMKLVNGQVLCSTCHGIHYSDSNSYSFDNASSALFNRLSTSEGTLLRTGMRGTRVAYVSGQADPLNICTNCHTGKKNHNLRSQDVQCTDCHGAHVEYDPQDPSGAKNAYLVRRYMKYSSPLGKNRKALLTVTGPTRPYRDSQGTGVCQACHDIPPTVDAHSAAQPDTAAYCNDCHEHNGQFGSFSGGCTTCHGFPPTTNIAGGPTGHAVGYTGVDESNSPHMKHASGGGYSFSCDECHKGNNHASGNFQQVFNAGRTPGIRAETNGGNPVYSAGTTRVCSNVYCHSTVHGADGSGPPTVFRAPDWNTPRGTLTCGSCHENMSASGSASGSHIKHAQAAPANAALDCNNCHNGFAAGAASRATHVSGQINMSFALNGTGTAYSKGTAFTPGAAVYGSCTTSYCHSNANSGGNGFVYASPAPVWGSGPLTCGSCHVNMAASGAATGKHIMHAQTYGFACGTCHNGYTASSVTYPGHVNQQVNLSFSGSAVGTQYSKTGAFAPGSAFGTCTASYCHSNGALGAPNVTSFTWAASTPSLGCAGCHGNISSTGSQALSSRHRSHMTNFSTLGRGNGYTCTDCHAATVSSPTTFANRSLHVNGFKDLSGARLPRSTSAAPSCGNSSCHSSGKKGVVASTVEPPAPAWTGTLGCKGCHGARALGTAGVAFTSINGEPNYTNGGEATATANSHEKHVLAIGITDTTECSDCHAKTVDAAIPGKFKDYSGGLYHLNGARNVVFRLKGGKTGSYDPATKTCDNTYCHGTPFATAWGGTGLNCTSCHNADNTLQGAHPIHYASATLPTKFSNFSGNVSNATEYRFTCSSCHADGLNKAIHADGPANANGVAQVFYGVTTNTVKGSSYTYNTASAGTDRGYSWTDGGSASCNTTYCHSNGQNGAGYAAGTAITWNGAATAAAVRCGKCHALAASLASGRHPKHLATYSFTCNACHAATASDSLTISDKSKHVNKLRDISFSATYGGAWTGSQCANTYCHSNANPNNAGFVYASPAWSGTLDCAGCHRNMATDTTGTGSHKRHAVDYAIACAVCHSGYTAASVTTGTHVNKLVEYSFSGNGAGTTYSKATGFAAGTAFGSCTTSYCHSQGNANTGPYVQLAPITWGATVTCGSCHRNMVSDAAASGSHVQHAQTAGYGCDVCHGASYSSTVAPTGSGSTHVNKQVNLTFTGTRATGTVYGSGTAFAPGTAYATCSTSKCHGSGTPTWGANTVTQQCDKCHSYSSFTPNFRDTAGTTSALAVVHSEHLNATSLYSDPVACGACHGLTTLTQASHMNGTPDVTFSGLAVSQAASPSFVAASHTCNNTYCHGETLLGGTGNDPVWTNTAYLTGTPANTGDCAKCHGFPPNTSGHAALAKPSALNVCTGCHGHVNADGTFTAGANRTKHINGQVDGGESAGGVDCSACHQFSANMANDTTTYHHPVNSTVDYGSATCLQCHADHDIFSPIWNLDNPSTALGRGGNLRISRLTAPTKSTGATNTDFGDFSAIMPGLLDNGGICIACHINSQTTTSSQKNNPPAGTQLVAISRTIYNSSAHQYTAVSTYADGSTFNANCSKCHLARATESSSFQTGNQFATHLGYDRKLLGGLGLTVVAGSDPLEENHCFRCHSKTTDSNPGGAAAKSTTLRDYYNRANMTAVAEATFSDFAKTGGRHNVSGYTGIHYATEQNASTGLIATKHVDCNDCHNTHAATVTTHTIGTNAVSGALTGARGTTPTFVASNWGGVSSYAISTSVDKEYKICLKCHNGSNTGWGGTGAAAWTDVGLEFNPANKSFHPVFAALNSGGSGSSPLAAAQLTNGWTPGMTMYCSDCHASDSAGSKGPHGSTIKWMLTGINRAWPYTTAAGNGGSSGTLWTYNNRASGSVNGVFCFNCHPSTALANHVHTEDGNHQTVACVSCHIRVPHGGKVSRLINTNTAGRVPRYAPAGNGTGTIQMTQFRKAASYSSYPKTYCQAGCASDHSSAVTSPETW